jgi:hypothetical protein
MENEKGEKLYREITVRCGEEMRQSGVIRMREQAIDKDKG